MINSRKLVLLTATTLAAGTIVTDSRAQSAGNSIPTFSELRVPNGSEDEPRLSRLVPGNLGLRPQTGNTNQGIVLPFGMNYSRETKTLLMSIDQKSEWGVGLNLNLNASPSLEQSPSSGLGLQPKRTPGVMLQKKF